MFIRFIQTVFLTIFVSASLYAKSSEDGGSLETIESAIALYEGNSEQQSQAILIFEKLAESENTKANYYLGFTYNDNAQASYYLGDAYYKANGVKQDLSKALFWHKKAAVLGYPNSVQIVGLTYMSGKWGVEKSTNEAIKWYQIGSDHGMAFASQMIGQIYSNGHDDIEVNIEEAIKWYSLSSSQGSLKAKIFLAQTYAKGVGIEADFELCYEWAIDAKEQAESPDFSADEAVYPTIEFLLNYCAKRANIDN